MFKGYKNTVIAIMLACILTMAVGYSILSQQLDISGTSNISSVWDVKITNIESSATGGASDKIAPEYTATSATFSTNLVSPGDKMTYDITVTNAGTLDAILDTINFTKSNSSAIVFRYSGITEGEILKAGDKTTMQVTVEYLKSITSQPETIYSELTITLDYKQSINDSSPIITDNYLPTRTEDDIYWFNEKLPNSSIETITFTTTNTIPNDVGDNYFDISNAKNGSIMAWYYDHNNNGLFEVTVGQDGGVVANANSKALFNELTNLSSINFDNFDASNITSINNIFDNCKSLKELDLNSWEMSNLKNVGYAFQDCISLETLKINSWDVSNVTSLYHTFYNCTSLTTLDLSNWNTASITSTDNAFGNCTSLRILNIDNIDTSNVTHMNFMFSNCKNLIEINVSDWDTSNVQYMNNMFQNCEKLSKIDVSNWDTSKVTTMSRMFYNCVNIKELDLSNWDTSQVTNMWFIFGECIALETIYASELWDNTNVTEVEDMFKNCTNLVGNIVYNPSKTDITYANYIDGYFTYKAAPSV